MALAGLALVLLPGLLVVWAPWTAVAPLSLAFWVVSAWWPLAGAGRGGVLAATIAGSLLLALLRLLPRHEVSPPPGWQPPPSPPVEVAPGLPPPALRSWPSLAVLAAALGLLVPVPLWHNAPGARVAFQTTTARLLLWRDGIPATAQPLLPLEPVGAHAPAVATLIADLSSVGGLDPGRAAPWVVAGAAALVLVGLFAVNATWTTPHAAALGALAGLALLPWPTFLGPWGDGEALVALAFLLPAAALAAGHSSRQSAVAAALLLAAGALAQPALAFASTVACAAFVLASALPRRFGRLLATFGLALVFAGPGLVPLASALSLRETITAVLAVRPSEILWFAFAVLSGSLAPLAFSDHGRVGVTGARGARVAIALAAALVLCARLHAWFRAGELRDDVRAALVDAAARAAPLSVICAGDGVRDFIPALVGRRAGGPGVWVPVEYSEEWAGRDAWPCNTTLDIEMFRR